MLDVTALLKIKLDGREFKIPRPTNLQFDPQKLMMFQTMVAVYTNEGSELARRVREIDESNTEEVDRLIEKLASALNLSQKSWGTFTRRLKFWIDSYAASTFVPDTAAEIKKLLDYLSGLPTDDDRANALVAMYSQALPQITGGELLIKNL